MITAQKGNDLLEAQKNLEIAEARLKVERANAEALIAKDVALAKLYSEHPEFLDYLIQQGWAAALAKANVVYLPAGTDPTTILNVGDGTTQPVVPVTPGQ